jgi:hypothetical protein
MYPIRTAGLICHGSTNTREHSMRSPRGAFTAVGRGTRQDVGEVLRQYEFHVGGKSADAKGKPSGKQTFGLLRRRHVRVERIIYIGKESNRLEEIEAGVIHSPETVYTEYPDPRRDEWQTKIFPVLKKYR